jgi:GNAT superfamily N-acetyltransferase
MSPLEAAYLSAKDRLQGLSFNGFCDSVRGAEIVPIHVGGEVAGALVVMGSELHACVLPGFQGRWVTRPLLRVLGRIVGAYGYATTSATTDEGRKFVERLGFVQEGEKYVLRCKHGY